MRLAKRLAIFGLDGVLCMARSLELSPELSLDLSSHLSCGERRRRVLVSDCKCQRATKTARELMSQSLL